MIEEDPDAYSEFPIEKEEMEADAFVERVLARHAELVNELGEQAYVFRGRPLDVSWIAQRALDDLAMGKFEPAMRYKLETMTGIDCSSFYINRRLQPLDAAVVLEEFLEGESPGRFVAGRRYFFGHAVP